MNNQADIDIYYKRNVVGISGPEFFWGLGLPIVIESTFLQLFLKNLGASSFAIGFIPSFMFIGCSIFALYGDYFTIHLSYKRGAVMLLHAISALAIFLFGIVLLILGKSNYILMVFFICYAVFSVCIGVTVPVWQNYLVKIFTSERSISALGVMMVVQSAGKLITSFFLVKIVEKYSFSVESSAVIFIGVGILFFVGTGFYLFTREQADIGASNKEKRDSFWVYTMLSIRQVVKDRNSLLFLAGDFDFYAIIAIISFYANYATIYCNIDPAVAGGVFIGCIYFGVIVTNVLFGVFGVFSIKKKYIMAKIFSIFAIILLLLFSRNWSFFLASFLLGTARGMRPISFSPAIKRLSGLENATRYFAVAPLITIPFAFSLPLLYGKILDNFSHLNGNEYRTVFSISLVIIFVAIVCIIKTDFKD